VVVRTQDEESTRATTGDYEKGVSSCHLYGYLTLTNKKLCQGFSEWKSKTLNQLLIK
jgi:hypothetical protein